jgi:hypothetical protein
MLSITAIKIRDNTRDPASVVGLGRSFQGFLISYPTLGRSMVIFREPTGHRMVTTPVRRVLGEFSEPEIYVETENSVYRLRFRAGAISVGAIQASQSR